MTETPLVPYPWDYSNEMFPLEWFRNVSDKGTFFMYNTSPEIVVTGLRIVFSGTRIVNNFIWDMRISHKPEEWIKGLPKDPEIRAVATELISVVKVSEALA